MAARKWHLYEYYKIIFIIFQSHEQLQRQVDLLLEYNVSKKLGTQPFVVICGPLSDIKCCHVIAGKIISECPGPKEAVDLCFKLFFTLRMEYPPGAVHLWSVIHRLVFGLAKQKKTIAGTLIDTLKEELAPLTPSAAVNPVSIDETP